MADVAVDAEVTPGLLDKPVHHAETEATAFAGLLRREERLQNPPLGFRVATAENATQALQRLEQLGRIDVLFTDLGLPGGMNGAELAEEVRRRHPDVHIICTTGQPKTTFFALSRPEPR